MQNTLVGSHDCSNSTVLVQNRVKSHTHGSVTFGNTKCHGSMSMTATNYTFSLAVSSTEVSLLRTLCWLFLITSTAIPVIQQPWCSIHVRLFLITLTAIPGIQQPGASVPLP